MEIIAIIAWVIIFNILNYWVMGYYKASFGVQATLIAFFVLCDVAIIYLLYKKVAYKHLNDIKKNIETFVGDRVVEKKQEEFASDLRKCMEDLQDGK